MCVCACACSRTCYQGGPPRHVDRPGVTWQEGSLRLWSGTENFGFDLLLLVVAEQSASTNPILFHITHNKILLLITYYHMLQQQRKKKKKVYTLKLSFPDSQPSGTLLYPPPLFLPKLQIQGLSATAPPCPVLLVSLCCFVYFLFCYFLKIFFNEFNFAR